MKRLLSMVCILFLFAGFTCGNNKVQQGENDAISQTETKDITGTTKETNTIETTDTARETNTMNTAEIKTDDKQTDTETKNSRMSRTNILIAYFSCTGTTKELAEYAAEILNADLYQIVPEVPYTEEDLAYYTGGRADNEQNNSNARPAISGSVENMEQYNTILLGYPIWHGQAPRIISTFLESYNFEGKIIVPFCTSHSSGIGSSDTNLHELCSSTVTWKKGKRFGSGTPKDEIKSWLQDFGIETSKTVLLNSGYEMPINGIGTYSLLDEVCIASVSEALSRGVRLIDTAYMYHNEAEVGEAVRNSGIPREEIFVTTKLYPNQYKDAANAIDEALERLDIEYIDLMLLHHPGNYDVTAYHAMEQAVKEGKIRSIGLSNWYIKELEEFLPQVTITPAVVQNEIHPYYQEIEVVPYIQSLGIVMEGWYPLGGRGYTAELLGDEIICEIAKAHNVSAAQVILRWNLQRGIVVIPGSSNSNHIQENTELYHFELSEEEMEQIKTLNRDEKHDWY